MGFLIVMLWMIIFLFLAAHFCALLECLFVNSRYQRYEKFKKNEILQKNSILSDSPSIAWASVLYSVLLFYL